MTSPTILVTQADALNTIRMAAQKNNATATAPSIGVYAAAGVTGLFNDNLAAYNSALDSAVVTGARADTTAEVQAIVDAYNTILTLTDGYGGVPIPVPTAAQYTAIGVTGLSGSSDYGTALHLLNSELFGVGKAPADTVAELQALANASKRVMAATGGTAAQAAALTLQDFATLHVTGVTAQNLETIRTVLRAVTRDGEVDTRQNLQNRVNATLGTSVESAVDIILTEAGFNSANATTLSAGVYATAGVTGVNSSNLDAINSAMNSAPVDAFAVIGRGNLQKIVDSYNAILRSADGVAGNTATALTGAQYSAVGVTGVSGTATDGSALHLLNNVVDGSAQAKVDTVPELQALANAASHVMAAAGGTGAQALSLTIKDLAALGITGVTSSNMTAVRMAIEASTTDNAVDTQAELQGVVNAALVPIAAGDSVARALSILRYVAQHDSATDSSPALKVYAAAGATGLQATNLGAYNSALDSSVVDGAAVYTTAKVQALVDAYNTILASTDGFLGQPTPVPSAAQYTTVGVTGLSGPSDLGTAVRLMDDSLFGAGRAAADTVPELQARADAATHVIAAAGGSLAEAAALTVQDMAALDVTGVTAGNIGALQNVMHAISNDFEVATKYGVQTIVNATLGHNQISAVEMIGLEALLNSANNTTLSASVFATAGVNGVNSGNLSSINSALNSDAIDGLLVTRSGELQHIVDAYSAILQSADGVADNTATALTGAQYTAVGVTGVSGTATEGSALHLLDSVVDASATAKVDTVPELQAMANAASHVMAAAGGTSTDAAALTYNDLLALGINTGQRGGIIEAVRAELTAVTHAAVDTQAELQALVTHAISNLTGPVIIIDDRLPGLLPLPAMIDEPVPISTIRFSDLDLVAAPVLMA